MRMLGAIVSGLFLVQACWVFINPDMEDFWEFCHWLGEGLLGFLVGATGCYLELRGSMRSVANHFKRFCLNRLGLTIFYFWMGCYAMGGKAVLKSGAGWKTVAHVTGVIAWIVALGDLLVACTSSGSEADEELQGLPDKAAKHETYANPGRHPGADVVGASGGDNPWGGHGVAMNSFPTGMPPQPDSGSSSSGGKKFKSSAMASFADDSADPGDVRPSFDEPVVVDQPDGGWNGGWNAGAKPFGCS